MAWTHRIDGLPLMPLDYVMPPDPFLGIPLMPEDDIGPPDPFLMATTVGDCIYLLSYDKRTAANGLQVIILHVNACSWQVVPPPVREDGPDDSCYAPVLVELDFALAYGHTIYVCGRYIEHVFNGEDVYAFDTVSLRWSCTRATGDVPPEDMHNATCVMDGVVYMCANCFETGEQRMYSLDLKSMRWKFLGPGGWSNRYAPKYAFPFGNRMYVLFECAGNPGEWLQSNNFHAMYFYDTADKTWEPIQTPRQLPYWRFLSIALVSSEYLYLLRNERSNMYPEHAFWEGVYRETIDENYMYSLKHNRWETVEFREFAYIPFLDAVSVVGSKAICFSIREKQAYVLDFSPSLRSMCITAVCKYQLDTKCLPAVLQEEISSFTSGTEYPYILGPLSFCVRAI